MFRMLNAITTVYFIIGLIILFGVIIPVLHRLVQLSLTWSLVVIYLAILFGVVVDFSHLTNELRIILAVGSILVTLSYIYSQACKEAAQRGEKLPTPEISLENKDRKFRFKLRRHPKPSEEHCCEDSELPEKLTDVEEPEVHLPKQVHRVLNANEPVQKSQTSMMPYSSGWQSSASSRSGGYSVVSNGISSHKPVDPNEITAIPGITTNSKKNIRY